MRLMGSIGHFVPTSSQWLRSGALSLAPLTTVTTTTNVPSSETKLIARRARQEKPNNPQVPRPYLSFPDAQVLSVEQCSVLIKHLEDQHTQRGDNATDLKLDVSRQELTEFLGESKVRELYSAFGVEPCVNAIKLRRVSPADRSIDFHLDFALKTMQIPLNDDTEYLGGRLAFLNERDSRLECPSRHAGSITIHDSSIVHGVSELTSGVRYGLFLLAEK